MAKKKKKKNKLPKALAQGKKKGKKGKGKRSNESQPVVSQEDVQKAELVQAISQLAQGVKDGTIRGLVCFHLGANPEHDGIRMAGMRTPSRVLYLNCLAERVMTDQAMDNIRSAQQQRAATPKKAKKKVKEPEEEIEEEDDLEEEEEDLDEEDEDEDEDEDEEDDEEDEEDDEDEDEDEEDDE